ncbi:hypothetical protein CTI14_48985, partial [Methylobacterium radiotolerans]
MEEHTLNAAHELSQADVTLGAAVVGQAHAVNRQQERDAGESVPLLSVDRSGFGGRVVQFQAEVAQLGRVHGGGGQGHQVRAGAVTPYLTHSGAQVEEHTLNAAHELSQADVTLGA